MKCSVRLPLWNPAESSHTKIGMAAFGRQFGCFMLQPGFGLPEFGSLGPLPGLGEGEDPASLCVAVDPAWRLISLMPHLS